MQGGGIDMPLNASGDLQAKALGKLLADYPLDVVASSHLQRAIATSDAVAGHFPKARRERIEAFGEMRFGKFEGDLARRQEGRQAVLAHILCPQGRM